MNVLFVCSSNLHRSKTAQDYCKQEFSGCQFQSAGTNQKSCTKHKTTFLSEEMLEWASVVYVMETHHLNLINEATAFSYNSKMVVLGVPDVYTYWQDELIRELDPKVRESLRVLGENNSGTHPILAQRIIALKKADLQRRQELIQNGQLGKGYDEEMEALHNRNAAALDVIINEIGYPTLDKVGEEGSEAAWLVIQHAISRPAFMKKCAQLLEHAVGRKEASAVSLAYLTDRIATFEGKPQLYGTQFDWDEHGQLSPKPCDNLVKVDQRRKSIGLNTLEQQTEVMRKRAVAEKESAPVSFSSREKEIEEWKKRVGWLE